MDFTTVEGWGEEKFVRDLKHSTKPFTGQASNNNLRWRRRKPGLSNIPLQNNACPADYNWRAKKTTASKTEGFQSVKLDISLPLLCSCAYIAFNMVDFKTHHASLPWTFALQARSEHYSQACHLWLPQTPWTRCNCWDWEVFDVTPPHHVTMRPICYSESSTEKQNTSIRRIFGIMYLRYTERTAFLQTLAARSSRARVKWQPWYIQKHKR